MLEVVGRRGVSWKLKLLPLQGKHYVVCRVVTAPAALVSLCFAVFRKSGEGVVG